MMGGCCSTKKLQLGGWKVHLLESDLPDFDGLCAAMRQVHASGRPVAFHCVSRVELVFVTPGMWAS